MVRTGGVFGNVAGFCRQLVGQITVSVIATVCVSAFFTGGTFSGRSVPDPQPLPIADTGKSLQRIAAGAVETTTLRYDPQQQAALASLASFTPTTAPALPAVVAVTAVLPRATGTAVHQASTVLPPPRPAMTASAQPVTPSSMSGSTNAAASAGWHIAGVEIPGSARLRQLVPTGTDLLHTGDAAWTASARVVRKVADVGSLFGL